MTETPNHDISRISNNIANRFNRAARASFHRIEDINKESSNSPSGTLPTKSGLVKREGLVQVLELKGFLLPKKMV